MKVVDRLYLMQVDFEKRARDRRAAVDQDFQRLRDDERRRQEEREALAAQDAEPPADARWVPQKCREFQVVFDDDDEYGDWEQG